MAEGTRDTTSSRANGGDPRHRIHVLPRGSIRRIARSIVQASAEAIWPTRCVICDRPGQSLCESCARHLPFIDRWLACPRCGSPNGHMQCVDCNSYSLSQMGKEALPFDCCVSAIEHRGAAQSIVTSYKDAGERSLARQMAAILGEALPRAWTRGTAVLTYVPADRVARRRRGFDHMAGIAGELSALRGLRLLPLLEKLPVADQRGLSRRGRFANMEQAIHILGPPGGGVPERVLLLDDVYTTGATLFAASEALRAAGVRRVDCATFARVP